MLTEWEQSADREARHALHDLVTELEAKLAVAVEARKENVMADQTYWVVRLEAFSFATKEEADTFRNRAEDVLMGMPDSETLAFFSTIKKMQDD